MVENDYIMRMIHDMIRFLIKVVSGKDTDIEETLKQQMETGSNDFTLLIDLVKQGRIFEAQNRLSDMIQWDREKNFSTALLFYEYLNSLDDETLLSGGFSREKIADGLRSVMNIYGYGQIAGLFLLQEEDLF